jgi:hypothetical protein
MSYLIGTFHQGLEPSCISLKVRPAPQPQEGPPERASPKPGLVQAQDEFSPAPHEEGANVQRPVAERLRFGYLEPAVEAGDLRPGNERPGNETGGHPGEVLGEARERQVL